jgi:S-DNA-T family DNA segregation ATPase FtsK/SpoIIIE
LLKPDKELPIALGKTISNEALIIDLAKMPHLAGGGSDRPGKISWIECDPDFSFI